MSEGAVLRRQETLEQVLMRRGLLPPDEACRLMIQLAEQLVGRHASGRLHGEVAPKRVLLSPEGEILLTSGPPAATSSGRPESADARDRG